MNLFIIHHHLNPGGVTRIIQSQVSSLRRYYPDVNISLMTGDISDTSFFDDLGVKVILNKELNYLTNTDITKAGAYKLLASLTAFFKQQIATDDIIHVHNLNLGKNPVMTFALVSMAEKGYRLFNHSHDFAEDRPANMEFLRNVIEVLFGRDTENILYPGYDNYRYGMLNSFDFDRLVESGIDRTMITLLPNPVHFTRKRDTTPEQARKNICKALQLDCDAKIITYPVRVIRRKNIGELALMSVLFDKKANWLVTQAPQNPEEITHYEEWKKFCSEHGIRIVFEAGTKVNFEELLMASDVCITTSTREGFGMVFMEPWLLDTPVMGRNISYVTDDLMGSGIKFPMLYDRILTDKSKNDQDFGWMTPEQQMSILKRLVEDNEARQQVMELNPELKKLFLPVPVETINHNKKVITENYSLKNYSDKLYDIYKKLA